MSFGWLAITLVAAILLMAVIVFLSRGIGALLSRRAARRRDEQRAPATPEPSAEPFPYASAPIHARPEDYRIEPFYDGHHVYTIDEFFELMKKYSMDSDNGWGFWARAKGRMVHIPTGKDGRVNVYALRQGERPDPLFTHIEYLPK